MSKLKTLKNTSVFGIYTIGDYRNRLRDVAREYLKRIDTDFSDMLDVDYGYDRTFCMECGIWVLKKDKPNHYKHKTLDIYPYEGDDTVGALCFIRHFFNLEDK